jgi:hypothetical protein
MNRWLRHLLQVVFAFVIVFLAGGFSIFANAIFHSQSNLISGIAFLVAIVCLVLLFERAFPSVYSGSRRARWSQWRMGEAILVMGLTVIISILSSRVATLWFGMLIISGVLVALLLRLRRRGGDL